MQRKRGDKVLAAAFPIDQFSVWRGLGIVAILLAAALSLSAADSTASLDRHSQIEESVLSEINSLRSKHGLKELTVNEDLREAARYQSRCMVLSGALSHQDLQGRTLAQRLKLGMPIRYRIAAENVARNRGYSDPAGQAALEWANSTKHLENILNPAFSETGVGSVIGPDGTVYLTQLFLAR
ncbi:MAG: CAP domain-containing protein [Acidobacteriota bacterium]